MSPALPYHLFAFLLSLIEVSAFYYLYQLHREEFLKKWLWSWGLYTFRFIFTSLGLIIGSHFVEAFVSELFALFNAYFLIEASLTLLKKKASPYLVFIPMTISLFTILCWNFKIIEHYHHYPAMIYIGLSFIWVGWQFFIQQSIPTLLRKVLGISLILWGLHKFDYQLLSKISWGLPLGFALSGALSLLVTLSFLLIYYQRHWQKLKHKEDYSNKLLQFSPIGLVICDSQGRFIRVNKAFTDMLGHSELEILQKTFQEITPPEFTALDGEAFARLKNSGTLQAIQKEFYHLNGKAIPVEIMATRIAYEFSDETSEAHFLCTVKDLTANKIYETQLKKQISESQVAITAKNNFLATISHEIRTPLHAICGMSEALQNTIKEEEPRSLIKSINKNSNLLMALINDIIDLAKAKNKRLELISEPFSLQALMAEVEDLFRPLANEKMLQFNIDMPEHYSDLRFGDSMRVKQVIINLLSNAIKFTQKGSVNLKLDADDDSLIISIADTGVGMSEDHLRKVFTAFDQNDSSITRKYGGSGLGLSICKMLVDKMKGKIECQSKFGVGTQFLLQLAIPSISDSELLSHASEDKHLLQPLLNSGCALLVDDAPDNITLLSLYFKDLKIELDSASNGIEALMLMKSQDYDFVIMDIHMPEMDGITATKIYREWEERSGNYHLPIIGLTADALTFHTSSLVSDGFDEILVKPIKQKEFIEHLYQVLKSLP